MHFDLDSIVAALIHFKYALVFPLAVIEGPILTLITGFLASLNVMNFWLAYWVVVAGDLVGDCLYYALGRFGRTGLIYKYGKYIGLHAEKLGEVERFIRGNINKVFIFGKFAHGMGSILWVGTGISRIPFRKFLAANFVTTCIKSFILIEVGYYYGQAYKTFDTYFRVFSIFFLILLLLAYIHFIRAKFQSTFENL